jgi:hypothetical protein
MIALVPTIPKPINDSLLFGHYISFKSNFYKKYHYKNVLNQLIMYVDEFFLENQFIKFFYTLWMHNKSTKIDIFPLCTEYFTIFYSLSGLYQKM